ncbi:L-lactate dehydrogenase [cytochrome] [Striga asiatica]|uniref:L-lactate dehydrogenase [cytochrome] n=1 Tax=Striga asiatica TaxID=4170 RepID=A0A5A7PCG0_STRAF|nr:L-lactate dehydrogenase [cytochrome] [Striga asiatica]
MWRIWKLWPRRDFGNKYHLRKVHAKNMKTYATRDVRSSRVQVGCNKYVGIRGTKNEPQIQPTTSDPNLQQHHKMFLLSGLIPRQSTEKLAGKRNSNAYKTHPIMAALGKLLLLSLRKYMQAARDNATLTWKAGPASAEFIKLQPAIKPNRKARLKIMAWGGIGSSTKLTKFLTHGGDSSTFFFSLVFKSCSSAVSRKLLLLILHLPRDLHIGSTKSSEHSKFLPLMHHYLHPAAYKDSIPLSEGTLKFHLQNRRPWKDEEMVGLQRRAAAIISIKSSVVYPMECVVRFRFGWQIGEEHNLEWTMAYSMQAHTERKREREGPCH